MPVAATTRERANLLLIAAAPRKRTHPIAHTRSILEVRDSDLLYFAAALFALPVIGIE